MKKNNYTKIGKNVIDLEIKALKKLKNKLNHSFNSAVNAIVNCKSKVILCGVGKSGLIASKISATFSSVGTPSFTVSASDCSHGDMGAISKKDILNEKFVNKNPSSTYSLLFLCRVCFDKGIREILSAVQKLNKISGDKFNLKIDTRRRKSIAIHHSSTHLLHQALRDVLGNHVEQKGSLVTDEGLRFDFSHNKALSKDEISRIEKIIAFEIDEAKKTSINQMSYKDAIKAGALAFFDEKYEDDVRVLNIGTKSMELCGGTHVDNTNDITDLYFGIQVKWYRGFYRRVKTEIEKC